MKIRYINESVFGNYKKPLASKEERMNKLKSATSKTLLDNFINELKKILVPYVNIVFASLNPYHLEDLGFSYNTNYDEDLSLLDVQVNKKGETWVITIGMPVTHTYFGASYDEINTKYGTRTLKEWLALAGGYYISNDEEVVDFCKDFFGDENFLFECKFSIVRDHVHRITIANYKDYKEFKNVFLSLFSTFNVETEDLFIKNDTAFKVDEDELNKLLQHITVHRGVTFRY